jgi:hypothetical protein
VAEMHLVHLSVVIHQVSYMYSHFYAFMRKSGLMLRRTFGSRLPRGGFLIVQKIPLVSGWFFVDNVEEPPCGQKIRLILTPTDSNTFREKA